MLKSYSHVFDALLISRLKVRVLQGALSARMRFGVRPGAGGTTNKFTSLESQFKSDKVFLIRLGT